VVNAVCVFCGSRFGETDRYRAAAEQLGGEIAARGLRLVYGGGRVGLMGALADAALARGGEVVGVIPDVLADREVAHGGLTELILTESMHERKATMEELADGFIALPGGFGTLEEFCEMLTWGQLGIHRKPLGLLDVDRFFDPLIAFFDQMTRDGFVPPLHRNLVLRADSAARLLDAYAAYEPPDIPPWANAAAT
jgi:uncharacterized protein (TIGR00730 family)